MISFEKINDADKSSQLALSEAATRMHLLGISSDVIDIFINNGKIPIFFDSILESSDIKQVMNRISIMQQKMLFPFIVLQNEIQHNQLYSIFYVSLHEEEWPLQREDAKHGYAMTYTINLKDDRLSEYGTICICNRCGSIERIG